MMIKMKGLFDFIKNLEKIMYVIDFKLIPEKNNNDKALFRVNVGIGAANNDFKMATKDITWCLPGIGPSNDDRIIVLKE